MDTQTAHHHAKMCGLRRKVDRVLTGADGLIDLAESGVGHREVGLGDD